MSSVSKPRVRHNRHKQGLNLTLEKLSADFRKKLLALLFSVILLAACDSGKYDQVAYYKDDAKMRVFVYVTDETDLNELQKHAKKQMHTDGATTAVFYYNELIGSTKSVTMAPNFHEALGRACTKWCVAGYWKYANGGEAFNAKPCEKE